jgi:cobalt/nickel transport system ATP-binding protein
MTPIIEAKDLSFRYPGRNTFALEGISLLIRRGERVAILGPNGAGKTTLLLLLAGLREPSSGQILINGRKLDKKSAPELRSEIGIVFQDPDDQIFMPTVEEDVGFGPVNMGLSAEEVGRRVRDAMLSAGLSGYEKRQPHHLSLGEKKRVALAGIIAMSPSILLLDEPTSGLDPAGKAEMMELLEKIGETIVLVTHDVDLALEFSDRTVLLNRKVLFDGDAERLFDDDGLLSSNGLVRPRISRIADILKRKGLLRKEEKPKSIEELERLLR